MKGGETMQEIKIAGNIPAGDVVPDGYHYRRAPEEPGKYSLYQLVDDHNCHAGWRWQRDE